MWSAVEMTNEFLFFFFSTIPPFIYKGAVWNDKP